MAIRFTDQNPIAGIAVGELKITRIGPEPGEIARVAYLSHAEGITVGECTVWGPGPWSEQTKELMDELLMSVERDVLTFLMSTSPTDLNGATSAVEEEDEDELNDGSGLRFE
jgi:hypothetical protein